MNICTNNDVRDRPATACLPGWRRPQPPRHPFLEFPLSVDEALDLRRCFLEDEPRPDYTFRPPWLPFLASDPNRALVLGCAARPDGQAAIHDVDLSTDEPWDPTGRLGRADRTRSPALTPQAYPPRHAVDRGTD